MALWQSPRPVDLLPDAAQAQELFQTAADAGHWGAAYAYAVLKLEENERRVAEASLSGAQ